MHRGQTFRTTGISQDKYDLDFYNITADTLAMRGTMKTKGALFYLQAEISGNYTTIAAMQSNSMTINQETVEITDKSMLFRELLENAGIGSVSTKAQGIVSNSASYQFIKDSVISGTIINCKLLSNTGEVYSGGFLITSFESSGTTSLIDNDFRLLEGGGFRLLEDGSHDRGRISD